jgi:AraC family transcriptional regulator of adaptative response / DNA-3-methyladenine glycosylase II
VALAAGYGSLRRFNETFRRLYGRSPSTLRRDGGAARGERAAITLTLGYTAPYDWEAMVAFFAARAIPGVEAVEATRYRRTIALGGCHGTIAVAPDPRRRALAATIRFGDVRALPAIVARIRRVFDLASDPAAIAAHLAGDPWLAPRIAARPGLRVPGAWDGFELAVRAVLGQQVTVAAARTLARRLVEQFGAPLATPWGDIDRTFPGPADLEIGVVTPVDPVIAVAARKPVPAVAAGQEVVAVAPIQGLSARRAGQDIIARAGVDHHVRDGGDAAELIRAISQVEDQRVVRVEPLDDRGNRHPVGDVGHVEARRV